MYRIDLDTLILMLRSRDGLLEASIPSLPGLKGRCRAVVKLKDGHITSMTIHDQQGHEISGTSALQLLSKKVLEWSYQEEIPPSTTTTGPLSTTLLPAIPQQQPFNQNSGYEYSPRTDPLQRRIPSPALQLVPVRAREPTPDLVRSWNRSQRSVYMLIDGSRSLGTIAQLLHQPDALIVAIVTEMAHYGVVSLTNTYQF